ncbi:MAG TPA: ROK family protein, partial [Dehalococcoidia bacterium]
MPDDRYIGAIDLGGTKILSIVVMGASMGVVSSDQRPTHGSAGDNGAEPVIERMVASIQDAAGARTLAGVGISSPGPLNPFTGVVSSASNLPGWRNVNVT